MGIRRLLSLPFHFDLKKWEKIFRPRGIAPADLLLGAFCLLLFRIQRNPRFEIGTAGGGRPWSLQLDLDGTLSAEEGILRVAGANASAKGSGAETGQRKFMTVFGPAGEREALGSILSTGGLAFLWEMGEGDAGSVTFHYDCY